MTNFSTNTTIRSGRLVNGWDSTITISLADWGGADGLRTRGNSLVLLEPDDGTATGRTLYGDRNATNKNDAIIYDTALNGTGIGGVSTATQRFANTFNRFELGQGNDVLDLTLRSGSLVPVYATAVVALGGAGADVLWTGSGNDTIYGEDTALSVTQSSSVLPDAFADNIHGGSGNDIIFGDYGSITYSTRPSSTSGILTLGGDTLYGGDGNDTIYGDAETVTFSRSSQNGSSSDRTINFGADTIDGGDGSDAIYGDAKTVTLSGTSSGTSSRTINFGADTISGGDGVDTIYGDADTVTLDNSGNRTVIFARDTIDGGAGNDTIYGDARAVAFSGNNSSGTRTVTFGNDAIEGGVGNDTIYGDAQTVTFSGSNPSGSRTVTFGNDTIKGGDGDDYIYGDAQTVTFDNNTARTIIFGNDIIEGGKGNDHLWGDRATIPNNTTNITRGSDIFVFGPDSGRDIIYDFTTRSGQSGPRDRIDVTEYGISSRSELSFYYSNWGPSGAAGTYIAFEANKNWYEIINADNYVFVVGVSSQTLNSQSGNQYFIFDV